MEYLFRGIGNKRWWGVDSPTPGWVSDGELLGDALRGLNTSDGDLSTFVVDSNLKELRRVAAAFACTRHKPDYVDYVLLPMNAVEAEFTLSKSAGGTPDDKVNKLHRDIVKLTPSRLAELAYLIGQYRCDIKRIPKQEIESEIRSGIDSKFIDCSKIKTGIKKHVCP